MASKGSMTTPWNSDTGEGRRFDRIGGDISGICTRVVANPFSMSRVYTNIVLCIACTRMRVNDRVWPSNIPRQQAFRRTLRGEGERRRKDRYCCVKWQELTLYLLVVFDLGKIRVPDIDQTPDTEDAFRDAGLLKVCHTLRYSSRRRAEIHRWPPRVFSLVESRRREGQRHVRTSLSQRTPIFHRSSVGPHRKHPVIDDL